MDSRSKLMSSGGSNQPSSNTAFKALFELSKLLNTGLDAEELRICTKLIESGVKPEALALVVRDLKRESEALRHNTQGTE